MAKATTMGPMKIKESASYRVFKVFNAIILTLISVAMLYPFLYLVAQSFSSTEAIVAGQVGLIPKDFNISTYKYVITDGKFIPYYGNTIVYSIIGTVCALLFSALLAYPLSKAELYGGKAINKFIIFTMYFGGGMIPNYILMVSLGLRDTVASFILPGMISTYYVILMRSFFLTLPVSWKKPARSTAWTCGVCSGASPSPVQAHHCHHDTVLRRPVLERLV